MDDYFYYLLHVHNILIDLELSNQRPIERAYQQDPQKVEKWLSKEYKMIKREGREIYFEDEAGFHETASYGKTWASKGQTPIIRSTGARTKVNCMSAISSKGKQGKFKRIRKIDHLCINSYLDKTAVYVSSSGI